LYKNIIKNSKDNPLTIIIHDSLIDKKKRKNFYNFKTKNIEEIVNKINNERKKREEELLNKHKYVYDNNIKDESIMKEKMKNILKEDFNNYYFFLLTYLGGNNNLNDIEMFKKILKNLLKYGDKDDIVYFLRNSIVNNLCKEASLKECLYYLKKNNYIENFYKKNVFMFIEGVLENSNQKLNKATNILMTDRINNDIFLSQ
jgi:hypothetical protein